MRWSRVITRIPLALHICVFLLLLHFFRHCSFLDVLGVVLALAAVHLGQAYHQGKLAEICNG